MAGPARLTRRLAGLVVSLGVRGLDLARSALASASRHRRPSGVVLYYHAVGPRQRARFARQMDELLKRAAPFPAGSPELMSAGPGNVAITFDDGFRSVVENALPELEARGIPFTMFVPSGCLGARPSWVSDPGHPSWNEQVLSAPELRWLAGLPLATLGSHTVTHRNLVEADAGSAARELADSRRDLGTAVGTSVDLFSFPYGAHSGALVEAARHAGYRRVFTVEPTTVAPGPDVFAVGRVAADPDDSLLEFRLKIAGAYRWRAHLHRLRRAGRAA